MTPRFLALLNLGLPGAGLVVRGHLGTGILLLVPTILVMAVMGLAAGLLAAPLASAVLGVLAGLWVLLALIAGALWWRQDRRERLDPVAVRALHREAVAAWLADRLPEALTAARSLVVAAPEEPGAWELLSRIAGDAGEPALARRATRRAIAIEAR